MTRICECELFIERCTAMLLHGNRQVMDGGEERRGMNVAGPRNSHAFVNMYGALCSLLATSTTMAAARWQQLYTQPH